MNNFSNNKHHDPHGFKEEIKIKYDSLKTRDEKFPNGTAAMMTLPAATAPPQDWAYYCGLTSEEQLVWGERDDELNKPMHYLMILKNKHAKKDLYLAYSQNNMTTYPPNIKGMARYLATQSPNNKPANQRNGKKGIKIREIIQNPKTGTVTQTTL